MRQPRPPQIESLVDQLRQRRLPPPTVRRRIRLDAGARIADVATALDVSVRTIERWEAGEVEPCAAAAERYRQTLDALAELAKGKAPMDAAS